MKKIKVLIVDDNMDAREILMELIGDQDDMEVVGIASNGEEALNLLMNTEPDIMLLDIIMPQLDGLGVLRKINSIKRPKVMVISSAGQDKITKKALALGADYYLMKPINFNETIKRIKQLIHPGKTVASSKTVLELDTDFNLSLQLDNLFLNMGFPRYLKGYKFLQEAIIALVKKEMIDIEIKNIYICISKKYDITKNKVRRDIQHAIEATWSRGNKKILARYFASKPSNKEFITTITEKFFNRKDR